MVIKLLLHFSFLRLSSQPGQFAVGYVGLSGEHKHYLVDPEVDTPPKKKTLADFLVESPQFAEILQVSVEFQAEICGGEQ